MRGALLAVLALLLVVVDVVPLEDELVELDLRLLVRHVVGQRVAGELAVRLLEHLAHREAGLLALQRGGRRRVSRSFALLRYRLLW